MTNLQICEEIWRVLDAQAKAYIDSLFPNGKPSKFYAVSRFEIMERQITKMDYGINVDRLNKKPTRKDVTRLRERALVPPAFEKAQVYVHWIAPSEIGFGTGATPLDRISVPRFDHPLTEAWTAEELAPTVAMNKERYQPREGYSPCTYCGQQRRPEDLHHVVIISRNWKDTNFRSPPRPYCKDKPCAGNDQMAHEG